jgi:hypothetical protein
MKLQSASPQYPSHVVANGIPTNFVRNVTPEGEYQVARVLIGGGPAENDFELLFAGSRVGAEEFLRQIIEKEFPGLL